MSGSTVTITEKNFEETLKRGGILFIDFWAEWCGPCKAFAPVFESTAAKHQDILFGKVDTDEQQNLAGAFGIQAIPTLAIFRDGILLFSQAGAVPAAKLEDLILQTRNLNMDDVRKEIAKQEEATARPLAKA
jgi:thioredoxin 1